MRVTRLEIFGFKSFVERFVLNFDQNIIGIVGPNGCGKSNIVDSLRWVLGETHAKQLRGSVQEDLIFNGSDGRRPMGMAEVSITISPDRDWQKDLPERLREMNEERSASDAVEAATQKHDGSQGAGTPEAKSESSSTEVEGQEQNAAEQDASAQNGETNGNHVASEAPAVRPDAVPAVRVIGSPLLNIPGLLDAAEIQMTRRLYRSGESEYFINRVPCRLRDMLDLYRLIGLGARGLSIVQQGTVGQIVSKKPVELRELLEEAAGISGFRTRIEAAQRKLDLTATNISRLRDIIIEVEKQLKMLKRQAKRAQNRQELKARLRQSELSCFGAKISRIGCRSEADTRELAEVEAGVLSKRTDIERLATELEALRGDLEIADNTLTNLRRKRDEFGSRLAEVRAIEQRTKLELSEVEGRLRAAINGLQKVDQRKQQIGIEIERRRMKLSDSRNQLSVIEGEHTEASEALAIVQRSTSEAFDSLSPEEAGIEEEVRRLSLEVDAIGSVSDEIAGIEADISRLRQELSSVERPLHEKRAKFAAAESERRSLEAQLDAMAEHVARAAGANGVPEADRGQVLLAGLRVPDGLQRVVAAILGDRAGFLLSDKSSELLGSFANRSANDKAVRLGVLSAQAEFTSPPRAEVSERDRQIAPSARSLIDLIGIDNSSRKIAELFLNSVVVVDSAAEGAALAQAREPGDERTFVTSSGEVLAPWGWWTTEGKGAQFSFGRRIEEQRETADLLKAEIDGLSSRSQEFQADIKRNEGRLFERREHHRMLVRAQERLSQLMKQRAKEERRRRDEAIANERRAQGRIRELAAELARIIGAIDFEEKRTEELKKDLVSLDLESAQLVGEQRQLEADAARLRGEINRPKEEQQQAQELEFSYAHLTEEIKSIDSKRSALAQEISHRTNETESRRREVDRLVQQENNLKVAVERYKIETQMLEEEVVRLYGEGTELPQVDVSNTSELDRLIRESEAEAGKLRSQIEREGEVDPQSIEMAETEQVRFDELNVQLKDLEQATDILSSTIKRLKEISRERFISTFHGVSTKYEELIPRLFGGGGGLMTLVNPEDPLSSGVEITVRPPGKKLRSLELMSGGEKALCATAILMAMFLNHPSPICVLDEVDAPLDDANLERFLDLIREISKDTQFLMITHNKLSMQAVGRLIGITMQESGVSTALTVSLEEIGDQVEQWAANG